MPVIPKRKDDETALTTRIASALDAYITNQSTGTTFTRHTTGQGLHNLPQTEVFPDIVRRLDEQRIIALEVKTQINHKFKSYSHPQRKVYEALFKCNVPIFYCYNKDERVSEFVRGANLLNANKASSPSEVSDEEGYIIKYDLHGTLLDIVGKLERAEEGLTGVGKGVLFPYLTGGMSSEIGIRQLLLGYNAGDRSFNLMDQDYLMAVADQIDKALNIRMKYRGAFKDKTVDEICTIFTNYTDDFSQSLHAYESQYTTKTKPRRSSTLDGPSM